MSKVIRDADFTPAQWMSSAEQKLADARALASFREDLLPRYACLWVGIAARFAVRAELLAAGSPTNESDNLHELASLLPPEKARVASHAAVRTPSRYGPRITEPGGEIPGLTWRDADEAIAKAAELLGAVKADLGSGVGNQRVTGE